MQLIVAVMTEVDAEKYKLIGLICAGVAAFLFLILIVFWMIKAGVREGIRDSKRKP